jgi:hypothetical protein
MFAVYLIWPLDDGGLQHRMLPATSAAFSIHVQATVPIQHNFLFAVNVH